MKRTHQNVDPSRVPSNRIPPPRNFILRQPSAHMYRNSLNLTNNHNTNNNSNNIAPAENNEQNKGVNVAVERPRTPPPTPTGTIHLTRQNVDHIILLDFDNVSDFFLRCDDAEQVLCNPDTAFKGRPIVQGEIIPPGCFVYCFYNQRLSLSNVLCGSRTFYDLLCRKAIEFEIPTSVEKNSADVVLSMKIGALIHSCPGHIKFTVVSEDGVFDEIVRRGSGSRDVMRFTRYLGNGRFMNETRKTHLDFFHHLHMRLSGHEVDMRTRYTEHPYSQINYTAGRSITSQLKFLLAGSRTPELKTFDM
eukprot:PhF_6_TR35126/c0_g1_i1/m.51205